MATHIDDYRHGYFEMGPAVLAEQPGHICDTACFDDPRDGEHWHSIDCLDDAEECEASMHWRGCPADSGSTESDEIARRSAVDEFNRTTPVGSPVRYWLGARSGEGRVSVTRTKAEILSGHTPVVWVEGESSCIALTHVDVETTIVHGSTKSEHQ